MSVRRLKFRNGIGWRKPVPFVNDQRLVWCASTEAGLDSMSQAVSMVDRVGRCFVSTKQASTHSTHSANSTAHLPTARNLSNTFDDPVQTPDHPPVPPRKPCISLALEEEIII